MKHSKALRKHKVTPRAKLKRKLDALAKELMYKRDGHVCVICGSTKNVGWGHVFSSRTEATRWDLMNIHAQCWPCNFAHVRDNWMYFQWMEQEYGKEELEKLRFRFKNPKRRTRLDLEIMVDEYTKLLTE